MSITSFLSKSYIGQYINLLIKFKPQKITFTVALMIIISLTEGISLLLLVPLLQLVGLDVQQGSLGQIANFILYIFNWVNIKPNLAMVLLIYVIIISLNAFLVKLQNVKSAEIQYGFAAYLRKKLFYAITNTDWLFFSKNRSSDFAHGLTNEIERISTGTGQFLVFTSSIFILAVYIIFALKLSGLITGLIFLAGIILLILLKKRTSASSFAGEELTSSSKEMYSSTIQHLDGMKTIKSFNMEEKNVDNFSKISDNLAFKYINTLKSYADVRFLFDVGSVIILSIIVFTLISVIKISIAELLILLFLFVRMIPQFSTIQRSYQYFLNMIPAFVNVVNLEKECAFAKETESKNEELIFKNSILLKNVSFLYNNHSFTIKNLNLKIPKGKTTALVGLSGAGKSTIADLIMGFIEPCGGKILIGDIPLIKDNLSSWRSQIGYVAQDTFLFNDTIRHNFLIANEDANDDEIWNVLKLASADEFVNNLSEKLDTTLGDRGVRLSGGEKQRLSLARALLRKPSLLILDEATSNLDTKNEKKIMHSIENLHGEMSILVIAHRLSTIQNADYIHLIKEGRLVESGTWNDLIRNKKGDFRALFENQK